MPYRGLIDDAVLKVKIRSLLRASVLGLEVRRRYQVLRVLSTIRKVRKIKHDWKVFCLSKVRVQTGLIMKVQTLIVSWVIWFPALKASQHIPSIEIYDWVITDKSLLCNLSLRRDWVRWRAGGRDLLSFGLAENGIINYELIVVRRQVALGNKFNVYLFIKTRLYDHYWKFQPPKTRNKSEFATDFACSVESVGK